MTAVMDHPMTTTVDADSEQWIAVLQYGPGDDVPGSAQPAAVRIAMGMWTIDHPIEWKIPRDGTGYRVSFRKEHGEEFFVDLSHIHFLAGDGIELVPGTWEKI